MTDREDRKNLSRRKMQKELRRLEKEILKEELTLHEEPETIILNDEAPAFPEKRKKGKKFQEEEVMHLKLDDMFDDLVSKDFDQFLNNIELATPDRHKKILAGQSCHGHAMNGDKAFSIFDKEELTITKHRYVNSTVSDVYQAIIKSHSDFAKDLPAVLEERQNMINELKGWVNETLERIRYNRTHRNYRETKLVDSKGKPLMGISLFSHCRPIKDPMAVLRGIYLGSYMDSPVWREQTEDYFNSRYDVGLKMRRGLCTAGNLENIMKEGLTISDLAHLGRDDTREDPRRIAGSLTLEMLKEKKMVVDYEKATKKERKEGIRNAKPFIPVYVEIQKGYGSSDDAAFNFQSLRDGEEGGYGVILIDAVDTIDKCVPYIHERGEDELIGDMIRDRLGGAEGVEKYLGITDQDILNLIFAAAIDKNNPQVWPSCSQRRFLEMNKVGDYALTSHIDHVKHISEGTPFPSNIKLSIKEISSDEFYKAFKERIAFMLDKSLIKKDMFRYQRSLDYFLKA